MRKLFLIADVIVVGDNGRIVIDGIRGWTDKQPEAKRIRKCYQKSVLAVDQVGRGQFPLIKHKWKKGRCENMTENKILGPMDDTEFGGSDE